MSEEVSDIVSGETGSIYILWFADANVARLEKAVAVMLYLISYCGSLALWPSTLESIDGGSCEVKAASFSHSLRLKRNGIRTMLPHVSTCVRVG